MSENIIQVLKDAFTDKAIDAISRNLGEDASKTKTGVTAIIPTVLGGVLGRSANATSAPVWWNTVADLFGGDDDDDLKLSLLGDTRMVDAGKGLLGSLFGNNLEQVLGSLVGSTGLNKAKAGGLLTTVAPMVIGYLSRWAKRKGLSFGSLMGNLLENKSAILGALPSGLGAGLLGLTDKPKEVFNDTERKVADTKTVKPKSNFTWLLLLLGGLILLWLLFGRGCNNTKDAVKDTTTEVVNDIDKAASDAMASMKGALNDAGDWVSDLGANIKKKLVNGFEMEIGVNSVENNLLNFIEDPSLPVDKATWFSLDRVYFESGSAVLKAGSKDQLDRLAAILKAYPAVNLKVGGYTDNTGPDVVNNALSSERAEATKAELISRGIDASRLEAEGYGSQHPMCPANDTPKCKAMNRRIDVRVTAK